MPGLILLGFLSLVGAAIAIEIYLRRGKRRPLASRFAHCAKKPRLGMEATDLGKIAPALHRNAALARKTGANGDSTLWLAAGATRPVPFRDDATYANLYGETQDERARGTPGAGTKAPE